MFFMFYIKIVIEHVDKQTVETDQTPRYVASDLGLRCLPVSQKMNIMLR